MLGPFRTAPGMHGWIFSVDEAGRLWVLEINANPCLSPDAGFAAALERAGIAYVDAIGRILADGCLPADAVSKTRQPAMAHGRS
jgi:hypothetical protein